MCFEGRKLLEFDELWMICSQGLIINYNVNGNVREEMVSSQNYFTKLNSNFIIFTLKSVSSRWEKSNFQWKQNAKKS